MKKNIFIFMTIFLLCNTTPTLAQPEGEKMPKEGDDFENHYFEGIKQKSIENYDKAIISFEKCLTYDPKNDATMYQLATNYLALKNYEKADVFFDKAIAINNQNQWYWLGKYDVSFETKNYPKSLTIIEKLINFNLKYKEDLVSVYMKLSLFDKALNLINELDNTVGKTDKRVLYKAQILENPKYENAESADLIAKIKQYPTDESNYLNLILLYSKNNENEKATQIAQQLATAIPTSEWAYVNLFKNYIDKNEGENAVKSMNIVLESTKIDVKIKHRILNEFLIFTIRNPQFDTALEKAVEFFRNDKTIDVAQEVGKFFQTKKDCKKAIQYYNISLKINDNLETILLLFQCYTENLSFDVLIKKSEEALTTYPSEPQLYYYAGLAANQTKQYQKAKDYLETGLDYLVENKALETNFYIQLGESYLGLGDQTKKKMYFEKAEKLIKK